MNAATLPTMLRHRRLPGTRTPLHGGPPPPNRPALVSKNPPPQEKVPFEQKQPAMQEHPGRPLEPQQKENLRSGQPAGQCRTGNFRLIPLRLLSERHRHRIRQRRIGARAALRAEALR